MSRLRLLCFPPVVAAEARFAGWRSRLPHGVETCLFDPVGQGNRGTAPTDLAELAAAAAAEVAMLPTLPLLVFGHREGALHAFETARALQAGHKLVRRARCSSMRR
jgi:surfactin synthase thioesterase subunit